MRRVHLLRHAVPAGHGEGPPRMLGRSDPPLGEAGVAQARALAARLATLGAAHVRCSPLARCRETAAHAGLAPLIDPALIEVDFGAWDGLTWAEVGERDPDAVRRLAESAPDFAFPGGERMADFAARVAGVLAALAALPPGDVLVVTHGGVIRTLVCCALGLDPRHALLFEVGYASLSTLHLHGERGTLAGLNAT